jgi:hypothetical protein
MNAKRKNLRTAIVSAGVCVILLIVISALSLQSSSDFINRRPSTFFTDITGARAIFLVIQRVFPGTDQWRRPLSELSTQPGTERFTMIVMAPEQPLSEAEVAVFDRWISNGGQLILAAKEEWRIRKPHQSDQTEEKFDLRGFLARHGMQPITGILGENATSAAVVKTEGAGRIVYVPDAYAFSNGTLRQTDDAVWLADRISEWGGAVFFDEYHHGFGQKRAMLPLMGIFLISPWGMVSLQLGLAGLVYLFGYRRRFGSPIEELPIERTSPVEAVEALGGLFETARASALSARAIHQYLNLYLTSLFGYSIDLSNPAIRERIASRSALNRSELESYADAVKHAIEGEAASDDELIRIAHQATTISRSFRHGNARQQPGRTAAAG